MVTRNLRSEKHETLFPITFRLARGDAARQTRFSRAHRFRRFARGDRMGWIVLHTGPRMSPVVVKPTTKTRTKVERPKLHKVILVNDDFTPREFVVRVLQAEFRMTEDQAHKVMITAHQRGVCVVAVFTRDVAETKATRATDAGRAKGYPLLFTTEPEE